MKMKRFETRVRKEIFWYSFLIIMFMLLIVVGVFTLYSYNVQRTRLNDEIEIYQEGLLETIDNCQLYLFDENETLFLDFLNNTIESSELYHKIYSFNSSQKMNGDMMLFNNDKEVIFMTNETFSEDQSFMNYIRIALGNVQDDNIVPAQKVFRRLNGESYMLLISPVNKNNQVEGYSIMIINGNQIRKINSESQIGYVLYDQFGNVFASSSEKFINPSTGKFQEEKISEANKSEDATFTTSTSSLTSYLWITTYEQNQPYLKVLRVGLIGISIIACILLIQAYFFSKKISYNIGSSLQLLMEEIENVKDNPNHKITIKTDDEFEDVAESINTMLEKLEQVNKENLYLTKLNIEAEKKKLEAQFNPHFLANTLETIRASIYIDPELAEKLILNMVGIFRYSIDEERDNTTLGEDEGYLRNFLDIQKERFEDFEYEISFDKKSQEIYIPKLFLLPLVENSLKYGFKARRDLKITLLATYQMDETILIEVKDNAKAISKDECSQLNEKLKDREVAGKHHGLKNSYDRLKLMYPLASMEIDVDEKYTIITIKIRGEMYHVSDTSG